METISPELVLVDPELAETARKELALPFVQEGQTAAPQPALWAELTTGVLSGTRSLEQIGQTEIDRRPVRLRRLPLAWVLLVALGVVVGASGAALVNVSSRQPSDRAASHMPRQAPPAQETGPRPKKRLPEKPSVGSPAVAYAVAHPPVHVEKTEPPRAPRTVSRTATSSTTPRKSTSSVERRARFARAPKSPPVLRWKPVSRAMHYRVLVSRVQANRSRSSFQFEVWTSEPILDLDSSVVELRPDFRYRWKVFPVFGAAGMGTASLTAQTPISTGWFELGR